VSITTRQGDGGRTRLPGGMWTSKTDPRMEALGTVDELVSVLGLARAALAGTPTASELLGVQKTLFLIGAECAYGPERAATLPGRLGPAQCEEMDHWAAALESRAAAPNDFVLPGETLPGAFLDLARTVARRCERRLVALHEQGLLHNPDVLRWINRLSDALWLLGRIAEGHSRPLHER